VEDVEAGLGAADGADAGVRGVVVDAVEAEGQVAVVGVAGGGLS